MTIVVDGAAPPWAHTLAQRITQAINRSQNARRPSRHQHYSSSALPAASEYEGHTIYVSDTNRMAYSDGSAWRYCSDEALV